jgi:hypothetical protein
MAKLPIGCRHTETIKMIYRRGELLEKDVCHLHMAQGS